MTNKELCKYIGITEPTIYAWKKNKKNLYSILMNWKKANLNILSENEQQILKIFNKLNEKEKEMYLSDMKARILKRELDQE